MPKLNPYTQKRAAPLTETREFYGDPANPDDVLTLTLSFTPGLYFESQVEAKTAALRAEFLTGQGDPNEPRTFIPPAPVLPVAGQSVPVSDDLCLYAAYLMTMERPAEGEKPYSFHEWAAFTVTMPTVFNEIVGFINDMIARGRAIKKPQAASPPSLPASDTDSLTPNSAPDTTP